MTCAFRISDSRCCLSCGPALWEMEKGNGDTVVVPTTRIDDISRHVPWGDFWGDGDLRDDVLYLQWVSGRGEARTENVHVGRKPP